MSQENDETILMHYSNGDDESISVYELSRWFGMIEAIDHLSQYASSNNIDIGEFTKKPAAIYEYINNRQSQIEDNILDRIQQFKRNDDSIFL